MQLVIADNISIHVVFLAKEVEQLSKVVDAYTSDRMLGDVDDVTNVSRSSVSTHFTS